MYIYKHLYVYICMPIFFPCHFSLTAFHFCDSLMFPRKLGKLGKYA